MIKVKLKLLSTAALCVSLHSLSASTSFTPDVYIIVPVFVCVCVCVSQCEQKLNE